MFHKGNSISGLVFSFKYSETFAVCAADQYLSFSLITEKFMKLALGG